MRGLLSAYKKRLESRGDELDELIYVVDSPRVAKLLGAVGEELGVVGGLTIRALDELIADATGASDKKLSEKGG